MSVYREEEIAERLVVFVEGGRTAPATCAAGRAPNACPLGLTLAPSLAANRTVLIRNLD